MKLHSRFRQVYDSKKALEVPPEGIHKSNNSVRRFSQLSISYSVRSQWCSGWECNFELGLFWQLWFFINIQHVILSERGRTADDEVPPPPYSTGGPNCIHQRVQPNGEYAQSCVKEGDWVYFNGSGREKYIPQFSLPAASSLSRRISALCVCHPQNRENWAHRYFQESN